MDSGKSIITAVIIVILGCVEAFLLLAGQTHG